MLKILRNRRSMERGPMLSPLALAVLLLLLTVAVVPAHAATLSADCSAAGDSLRCHLAGILNILYIVAVILGVALIVIAIAAYSAYRRNRAKRLEPRQASSSSNEGHPRS